VVRPARPGSSRGCAGVGQSPRKVRQTRSLDQRHSSGFVFVPLLLTYLTLASPSSPPGLIPLPRGLASPGFDAHERACSEVAVLLTNLCLLLVGCRRVLTPGALLVAPWSLTSSSPRSAELLDESRLSRRAFSASACRSAARHPPLLSLQKYKLLPSLLSPRDASAL
jgi:hypothetical protein